MLLTWCMLGGLALLVAPRGLTGKLQLGFASVFRLPLSVGRDFALSVTTDERLRDAVSRREHNSLRNHANNLEAMLRQQQASFKRLSELYSKYDAWEGVDFAEATVVASNAKGARRELIINYLRNARVAKDQFVLNDNSVIGRISDASGGTAHVRLFTDPESNIKVKIGRLDVPMMMTGSGDNSARISLVKAEHEIKPGDIVFASGGPGGLLGGPMTIGSVARCVRNRKRPLEWDITVEPVCDLENLEDVTVIIMNPQQ